MSQSQKDEEARRNRERHPEVALFIDEVTKFWPEAKVVYFGDKRQ